MRHRAVIFDLGGVILGSPLHAIAEYERRNRIAEGRINRVVVDTGREGAWSRLERGELPIGEFYAEFEADCRAAGFELDAREMMERMAAAAEPRPVMLAAVACIREAGLIVSALTNNWVPEQGGSGSLKEHFDHFVESSVVGLRKPDPRIYHHACETIGVAPDEAIFLDDIGSNVKAARALGMATIKVVSPAQALPELEALLGFALQRGA